MPEEVQRGSHVVLESALGSLIERRCSYRAISQLYACSSTQESSPGTGSPDTGKLKASIWQASTLPTTLQDARTTRAPVSFAAQWIPVIETSNGA